MKPYTTILIEQLNKKGSITTGKESIAEDGTKYRYDRLVLNAESAPTSLENIFSKASMENGFSKYCSNFSDGTNSFHFERANFKTERNGKITISLYKEI